MFRQQSIRNHNSKGFKLKHALHISVLVAICVWLLYQVKHSHDKKEALEEKSSRISFRDDDILPEIFNLGRKDLARIIEIDPAIENQNVDEGHEQVEEGEEENTPEGSENGEGRGTGDDEVGELDQEKADEEAERGEEFDEQGDKDSALQQSKMDSEDHEAGSQQAREDSFNGDDASSAVLERGRSAELEPGEGDSSNKDEEHEDIIEKSGTESENTVNGTPSGGLQDQDDSGSNESVDDSKSNDSSAVVHEDEASPIDNDKDVFGNEERPEMTERKDLEAQNIDNGTANDSGDDDSAVPELKDDSKVNDSSVLQGEQEASPNENGALEENSEEKSESEVGNSEMVDETQSTSLTVEDNSHIDAQADQATLAESDDREEPQTTASNVSEDQMEAHNTTTALDLGTNNLALNSGTADLVSVQEQNATVATETDDLASSDNVFKEQSEKPDTVAAGLEETKENSGTLATSDNGDALKGESNNSSGNEVNEVEVNHDSTSSNIIENEPNNSDRDTVTGNEENKERSTEFAITDNGDTSQVETSNSSGNVANEAEVHHDSDLSTSSNFIKNEANNSDGVAAE